jgi:hypothetical protein
MRRKNPSVVGEVVYPRGDKIVGVLPYKWVLFGMVTAITPTALWLI